MTYNGDKSDLLYFVTGEKYEVLSKDRDFIRVVDETGEDYLYDIHDKEFELDGQLEDVPDEVLLDGVLPEEPSLHFEYYGYDDSIAHLLESAYRETAAGTSLSFTQRKKQKDFRMRNEWEFNIPKSLTFKHSSAYLVKKDTLVNGVVAICIGEKIREVDALIQKYPLQNGEFTKAVDWKKMRGTTTAEHKTNGTHKKVEIHWYECPNIGKVDFKYKPRPKD